LDAGPRFQHRFWLSRELMEQIYKYLRALKNVTLMLLVVSVILTVLHFPYDVDAPLTPQEIKVAQEYYTEAYQKPVAKNHEESGYQTEYLRVAQAAADACAVNGTAQKKRAWEVSHALSAFRTSYQVTRNLADSL